MTRLESLLRPEGTEELRNPCRGWYDLTQLAPTTLAEANAAYISDEYPLGLLEINWAAYRDRAIPDEALAAFDAILSRYRALNRQVVLRMLYDWNGECWKTEPSSVERIIWHINQCAPVLKAHADVVFLLQGVLLGNWAEMHSSPNLNPENVRLLIDRLADCTDASAYLAVRTPAYHRICTRSDRPDADGALASRLSVYNDALYSSVDDMGTYGSPDAQPANYAQKRTPKDERAYLAAIAKRVPFGGETAALCDDTEGNAFLRHLHDLPITYLNAYHFAPVLDAWKATPCKQSAAFRGKSCYDAIGAYLGYRLLVDSCKLKRDTLVLSILNIGSAPLYRSEPVECLFLGDFAPVRLPIDADTRLWKRAVELTIPLPTLRKGDARVFLRIGDVRLANDGAFDEDARANLLGVLHTRGARGAAPCIPGRGDPLHPSSRTDK